MALDVMRDILVVAIVLVACAGVAWFLRSRVAEQHVVQLSDIPQVYERLKEQGSEGAFAVFMFSDHGKLGEEGQVNIQFSVENGTIGMDWVLIGPVNIRDEKRIDDFLRLRGSPANRREGNGVRYLRTEQGDLTVLCRDIIKGLYGVKGNEGIDLVPEGFSWRS